MSRKKYNGFEIEYIPVNKTDITTESLCYPETIQYYFDPKFFSTCQTEVYEEGWDTGFSINWTTPYRPGIID